MCKFDKKKVLFFMICQCYRSMSKDINLTRYIGVDEQK